MEYWSIEPEFQNLIIPLLRHCQVLFLKGFLSSPSARLIPTRSGSDETVVRLLTKLFVQFFDETGLFQLRDKRVVDELFRLSRFAGGIDRIVEQGLHASGGNVRRLLPEFHIGVVSLVEVFLVIGLGVFGNDLLGRLR